MGGGIYKKGPKSELLGGIFPLPPVSDATGTGFFKEISRNRHILV